MTQTSFSRQRDIIEVKARIALIASKDGGKQNPIYTRYRPNHVFEYRDGQIVGTHIGEIQLADGEKINPGEERIATVFFLKWPGIIPFIEVGRKWWIHEANKLVGTGEILEIVNQP